MLASLSALNTKAITKCFVAIASSLLPAEERLREQDPEGLKQAQVAELLEGLVKAQSVPAGLQCQHTGCSAVATVRCCSCQQGGLLLCEAHDQQQHSWAHTHEREGLLNGFRQPLRPTQLQYDPQQEDWVDLPRCYNTPPGPCSCGSGGWTLAPATYDKDKQKKLIVITGYGAYGRQALGW